MTKTPIKSVVLLIAGIIYIVGEFFRGAWFVNSPFNTCHPYVENQKTYCNSPYLNILGWPLITIGEILFVAGIVVLFANQKGLRNWIRFNYGFIPFSVIAFFVILNAFPAGGLDVGMGSIDPIFIIHVLGYYLYLPITLVIVIFGYVLKKQSI